jgi:hypothetical protein
MKDIPETCRAQNSRYSRFYYLNDVYRARSRTMPLLAVLCLVSMKEKFEVTKWVIRSRKSKDRTYNGKKKKKDTWTNNNLQNTTQKTNDRATQAPLKSGV